MTDSSLSKDMNVSPTSSPTKMTSNSPADDSPREEEHDWESYLIETNSEAAPAENFKQALIPPENNFALGEKLESIDPRNQDSWCIGTIIEKDGPRLRIRLDGTDDRNDFWRLVDSTDIRCHGTTAKLGGHIVPPLGFQQNSTRWAKYFDKYVKAGPFAAETYFKPQPVKPEKNWFKRGQKLEAVDPRHPQMICPATVSNVMSGDHRMTISLDGWSSSNNFKVDFASREIFPVGWCRLSGIRIAKLGGNPTSRTSNKAVSTTPSKQNGNVRAQPAKTKAPVVSPSSNDSSYSPTTMDEKNNNLVTKRQPKRTSNFKRERRSSHDFDDLEDSVRKDRPIVTVYLNYMDDNSGMLLNPQKFRQSMSTVFGPAETQTVLTAIFNSCVKCAFQQTSFIKRILDIFPTPKDDAKESYTPLKLDNGTTVYIAHLDTLDEFWDVIRTFQNVILSGNDLFISTPPPASLNNQSNGSSSSFLDSSLSPDKKESSPAYRSLMNNGTKRKSTELTSSTETKTFISNGKSARSNSNERSVYDTKPAVMNSHPMTTNQPTPKAAQNGGVSHRPERFTPSQVAAFVRGIDPSFDSLAARFLQEEIDGKALLLLTTDTLMRHMGLKLGPSLKIVHHIEKLKKP